MEESGKWLAEVQESIHCCYLSSTLTVEGSEAGYTRIAFGKSVLPLPKPYMFSKWLVEKFTP